MSAVPLATRRLLAVCAGAVPGERSPVACFYCGASGTVVWERNLDGSPSRWLVFFRDIEVDHLVPRHRGGTNDPGNLVFACGRCNRRKGHRYTAPEFLDLIERERAAA